MYLEVFILIIEFSIACFGGHFTGLFDTKVRLPAQFLTELMQALVYIYSEKLY